ncbi:hypothetical protein BO71DRAFT_403865 [Aspergillus ellipticus CBS 707.79]|uniref:Arrestin-like N-terminal domain-containing protein n=1 Tax=Aspergillus ellipticus CBS 707.79 TaxID=1448320 RepID=A0A319CVD6_9EURO|nr:hypothetical protein BO71DRAFT_403865 [Aspergillus ellipticus CBS 707.79]
MSSPTTPTPTPTPTPPRRADLEVSLDQPDRLFVPGDTITGTVHNWAKPARPSSIDIILEGRSKTCTQAKSQSGFVNRSRVPLVYQVHHVEVPEPPSSEDPVRYAITVPDTVDLDPTGAAAKINPSRFYWSKSWTEAAGYKHEPGHALPPSMMMPTRVDTREGVSCGWGHIQYTLRAVQTCETGGQGTRRESDHEAVRIGRARISREQFNERFGATKNTARHKERLTIRNRLLDPCAESEESTWKNSVKDAFRDIPTLVLILAVTAPKAVALGDKVNLGISLAASSLQRGFPLPSLTLHHVNVHLVGIQGLRVMGRIIKAAPRYEFPGGTRAGHAFTTRHVFHPTEDDSGYQDTACEVRFRIPASCLPTFQTYNIQQKWQIKVETVFRCVKQEVKAQIECDLELVACQRSGDGEADDDGASAEAPPLEEYDPNGLEMSSDVAGGVGSLVSGISMFT